MVNPEEPVQSYRSWRNALERKQKKGQTSGGFSSNTFDNVPPLTMYLSVQQACVLTVRTPSYPCYEEDLAFYCSPLS
jgi:hypothetical protein